MKHLRMASLPEREQSLKLSIEAIRPQVDTIFVVLNNYDHVPDFLNEGEYMIGDNSMTDAMKFIGVDDLEGYIFILDDDIVVPENYCNYMINGINKYNAVVTLHGKTYPRPPEHFKKWIKAYRCLGNVGNDVIVDVPGTGIIAYHTDIISVRYSDFEYPNMCDIFMGKICYEQKVPIWCLAHSNNYLQHYSYKETLWRNESKKGFVRQTELLKSFLK